MDINDYILTKPELAQAVWARYDEPHRFYHNRDHVMSIWNAHLKYRDRLLPKHCDHVVATAALYHDCVYNIPTGERSNEDLSFDVFRNDVYGFGGTNPLSFAVVRRFIDGTKDHWAAGQGMMIAYFCDLDLISFGLPYEEFKKINENISKEYYTGFSVVETELGRLKFLNKILKYGRVFQTDFIKDELEETATSNIRRYIDEEYCI